MQQNRIEAPVQGLEQVVRTRQWPRERGIISTRADFVTATLYVLGGEESAMTQTVWDVSGDVRKALRSIVGDPQLGTGVLTRT